MLNYKEWHSRKTAKRPVYHNNPKCKTGDNIQRENVLKGTGGRPLCDECKKLNVSGLGKVLKIGRRMKN
jgi:hypothetical protein